MRYLLLLTLFTIRLTATAQELSGNWAGSHSNSLTSFTPKRIHMSMVQTGDSIHGSSRCIDNSTGQYTICTLRGVIRGNSVTLYEEEVLESKIDNWSNWCLEMHTGVLVIDSAKKRMIITGTTHTNKIYSSRAKGNLAHTSLQCSPGDFIMSRSFAVAEPVIPKTVTPPVIAAKPKTITQAAQRKLAIIEKFNVVSDSLTLSFYDDANVDGDMITVYYNKKVILNRQLLSEKPLIVTVPVVEGIDNELVMFADNVGSVPPNTAVLVFYDEGIRRQVTISSDTKKSGTILIRK